MLFIRKAIGWVLRSAARRSPARVSAYVAENLGVMSGLTFREATRNLPAAQQKKLVAQRRADLSSRQGRAPSRQSRR